MASAAVHVEAAGRSVRVSSPDRVIFEATEFTPDISKLAIVQYYLAVEDGLMRALRNRPTTMERWPNGYREAMTLSTRESSKGDAFYQKRVPRGAPEYLETAQVYFPSGRRADQMCPTEIAVAAWAAQMGTLTFHPWAVRRADLDRPDELRIDLDPQGQATYADAVRVAFEARTLLHEIGMQGYVKTSGNRGVHVFVRLEPLRTFTDVRHAAIAFGRELERRDSGATTAWWKEERGSKIFIDFNQNARDRTIASAYSLRPKLGAPVSTPVTWDELGSISNPAELNIVTVPKLLQERADAWSTIDDTAYRLDTLLQWYDRDQENGLGEMPYPPDYPKMPGEPKRVQPSRQKT